MPVIFSILSFNSIISINPLFRRPSPFETNINKLIKLHKNSTFRSSEMTIYDLRNRSKSVMKNSGIKILKITIWIDLNSWEVRTS